MKDLAPHIIRKRLLIEGFYKINVDEEVIKKYFEKITKELGLRTYGPPIIHSPSGEGKEVNQGYDAFVPLIDSGIYVGAWTNEKFLSAVIYTCKDFNVNKAVEVTKEFWKINEVESKQF
ncbi:MAG: S-adenosylmethionine decarboxylase [Candidatus Nanoarchaeia archaeon]